MDVKKSPKQQLNHILITQLIEYSLNSQTHLLHEDFFLATLKHLRRDLSYYL